MSHLNKNVDFNAKDRLGLTLFLKVCINGHKEVVKLLFDHSDSKMRHFWGIFQHCDVSLESNIDDYSYRSVTKNDEGLYECQISTEPKMSFYSHLSVVGK